MATIKGGQGIKALAVLEEGGSLKPTEIGRPEPGPNDVHIKVLYCGQCHSDLHATNGEWGINLYPMTPGHEIAGTVMASNSPNFLVGQNVGVGCMVESCRSCDLCDEGLENHCPSMIQTYSASYPKASGHDDCADYHTNGGYSEEIVVRDRFVFAIPDALPLEFAGPLLCAGITTYSPLNRLVKGKKDQSVGVVGFGGLGMMTAKLAIAMGAKVTIISRNLSKAKEAEAIGANLVSHQDSDVMTGLTRTFNTIIDTVSVHHNIEAILSSLKVGGNFCFLGGVPQPYEISAFTLLFNRYNISGSLIGGVPETKEMLDFCVEHNVFPTIQIIKAQDAAGVFEAMQQGKAGGIRNVIDMSTIGELFE
uniref:Enoyl reductase (ER) domain-containing protein n=1 Tax=Eucampia antarctica TaxID=49252 RepID=A0A6U0TKS4_9STRA|mmetsp:Transcript_7639/g.7187  ORF Transcript_7639/g.7187 Transcript_7639/m.7187 type:complete len:364 (+) Transcript_7639:49-1140(+)|eukprot:CAMPEP_0197833474 /NCGR_PEP_ID=MMETSP1437-20131217/19150_1 /TAXON_ID=49252 ORGANISM="Eucampia antarctica, Strain CCMP1452" /NCGR_SAMPLE_ID=MMETSP1437 /ASSEMBLY_ACC=CAM_ASM_001096 /LENGTH=363 /DNA_ID=CAMNT_0043437551 /DNA_START=37 /DNA_END=1128 /DNA_ORIENTATION=-